MSTVMTTTITTSMTAIDILSSGDVAGAAATGVEEEDVGAASTPAPAWSWFVLGKRQDRVLEVQSGVVRITSASVPDKFVMLTTQRWAHLMSIDVVVREIKIHRRPVIIIYQQFPVNYFAHIANRYYVTVTLEYGCVDTRHFYFPYGKHAIEYDMHPTRNGLGLRFDEWAHLLELVPTIHELHLEFAESSDKENSEKAIDCII